MDKFLCFLTGGHRYSAEHLQVYDTLEHKVVFINTCDKCGKEYKSVIDEKFIFSRHLSQIYESEDK